MKTQNWQSLILQLKQIAEDKGISQGDIARETGYYRQNINRFFQGRVCPSMEMFLNVCRAVEAEIWINQSPKSHNGQNNKSTKG